MGHDWDRGREVELDLVEMERGVGLLGLLFINLAETREATEDGTYGTGRPWK